MAFRYIRRGDDAVPPASRWAFWARFSPSSAWCRILDGRLRMELFPEVQGLSTADLHQLAEIRTLGGEAHFMERSPRFLGRFGGHDLLFFSFGGKSFDDEALARFVQTYGDQVWGLDLTSTGVTDAGLRHLAGLPHIKQLALGNIDRARSFPAPRFRRTRSPTLASST